MAGLVSDRLGLYISIPFCRSKCTYCNFASGVYPASEHARYVDRLIGDLAGAGAWAAQMGVEVPGQVDTIYLGGGTPSLLAPELISRLFAAMRAEFDIEAAAEITVECAPGQIRGETLEALALAGVNRVSLGVQSFIDREAQACGRLHSRGVVLDDLRRLRAAGIANLSVDLIAGLAGQTFASWEESLAVLVACGVPHASVYMLEVDEDSRLGREMLAGGARYHAELVPTDDAVAQMYETAIERLARAGLRQYEISNFSQREFQSRHNLRYWERRPYLGLGLDASSMLRDADIERHGYVLRAKTTDDLKAYLLAPQPAEAAWLSPEQQHEEAWFLGLRLNKGVKPAELRNEFGDEAVSEALCVVARLEDAG
ncbi:MAG: radical SAM family heme chaperone HemW, partial [Terracidiphilus sp.]